jgi:histone H3/H4
LSKKKNSFFSLLQENNARRKKKKRKKKMSQLGDMFEDLETVPTEEPKKATKKRRKKAPVESDAETQLPPEEESSKKERRAVTPEEQEMYDNYINNIVTCCTNTITNVLSDNSAEAFLNGVDDAGNLSEADMKKIRDGYSPHIPKRAYANFLTQANLARSDEGAKQEVCKLVYTISKSVMSRALLDMASEGKVTISPTNVQTAVDLMGKSFV